jgi:hypothetical protein
MMMSIAAAGAALVAQRIIEEREATAAKLPACVENVTFPEQFFSTDQSNCNIF